MKTLTYSTVDSVHRGPKSLRICLASIHAYLLAHACIDACKTFAPIRRMTLVEQGATPRQLEMYDKCWMA